MAIARLVAAPPSQGHGLSWVLHATPSGGWDRQSWPGPFRLSHATSSGEKHHMCRPHPVRPLRNNHLERLRQVKKLLGRLAVLLESTHTNAIRRSFRL